MLSFEEENIEEQAKFKIMEDFEAMAFAGVPEEYRPPVLWVEHRDKGRLELNYLTFNALTTGRSFAVYYDKKDRRLFNDFTEVVNYEGVIVARSTISQTHRKSGWQSRQERPCQ